MYRWPELLNPEARPFVKFTMVDSTYPGQVEWSPAPMATSLDSRFPGGITTLFTGLGVYYPDGAIAYITAGR